MTIANGSDSARTGRKAARRAAKVHVFAKAAADDLELLALLHDREPTAPVIEALQSCPLQQQLGLVLQGDDAKAALRALAASIAALPRPIDPAALDELAAGYADVYLRHYYRAAPTESVWVTEDGLERQAPMFEVRETYRRHNLKVADWANRADDHIVLQLRFVAHLLGAARTTSDLHAAVGFLDAHLLRWVRRLAERLIMAGAPDFYAAIAVLTACYLDELREHLAEITGTARSMPPVETGKPAKQGAVEVRPYFPGASPSW